MGQVRESFTRGKKEFEVHAWRAGGGMGRGWKCSLGWE